MNDPQISRFRIPLAHARSFRPSESELAITRARNTPVRHNSAFFRYRRPLANHLLCLAGFGGARFLRGECSLKYESIAWNNSLHGQRTNLSMHGRPSHAIHLVLAISEIWCADNRPWTRNRTNNSPRTGEECGPGKRFGIHLAPTQSAKTFCVI